MSNVLEVKNLTKIFGSSKGKKITKPAVDRLSFELEEGEILGLLGPNGAGKTTTIQMLIGALSPTSGEILYFGSPFSGIEDPVLGKINFSSAYTDLPGRMTVWESLDVYARLYGVKNRRERIYRLAREFDIEKCVLKKFNSLSAGQKTRVLLIKGMINFPRILLLDEPTASLDPEIAHKVRRFLLMQQDKHKVSILFTSHNMHEIQEICDRVIFLNHGVIVAEDTPMGIIKKLKRTSVRLLIERGKEDLTSYCENQKIALHWKKDRAELSIEEEEIPKTLFELSKCGVRYSEIEILRPTLEDFFLEQATKTEGDHES